MALLLQFRIVHWTEANSYQKIKNNKCVKKQNFIIFQRFNVLFWNWLFENKTNLLCVCRFYLTGKNLFERTTI